jgi:hypothetical protein
MSADRDYVLEASVALSTLSADASTTGRGKEVEVLCDLLDLLHCAEHVSATHAYGFTCRLCGALEVDEDPGEPSLLRLLHLIQRHSCRQLDLARAAKAREAEQGFPPCEGREDSRG